jgi:SMC interacting uncharacterized protein involved in chromosome segregation
MTAPKEKTMYEELCEYEKSYLECSQQVEEGKAKQLEYLQKMVPRQNALLTNSIKTLQEENAALKEYIKELGKEWPKPTAVRADNLAA